MPRDEVGFEKRLFVEFHPLFSSRFSDRPKWSPRTLQHICPAIYSFLLSHRFADRHSLSSRELFELPYLGPCENKKRRGRAFRRGTCWRVRETGKQRPEGGAERKRERERGRMKGRENVRKIDCENSRDTSLFAEILVLDECTTIFTIAGDCRSRGKCFQGKYWILSKTDWLKSWKQIFFIVFENSRERSITCALVSALISSRASFQAQRVHCVEMPVEKYLTFNAWYFIFHQEMEGSFSIRRRISNIYGVSNNFMRMVSRRAVIRSMLS